MNTNEFFANLKDLQFFAMINSVVQNNKRLRHVVSSYNTDLFV